MAKPLAIARVSLERGPFARVPIKSGDNNCFYTNGSVRFHARTINKLIETGEAVRVGTGVVHANAFRRAAE